MENLISKASILLLFTGCFGAFCWFMTSCILFAGTVIIGEVYFY